MSKRSRQKMQALETERPARPIRLYILAAVVLLGAAALLVERQTRPTTITRLACTCSDGSRCIITRNRYPIRRGGDIGLVRDVNGFYGLSCPSGAITIRDLPSESL